MEKKEFFILIKMNFSSDSKEFFKLYFYRGKVYHQKSSIVFNSFLHAIFWLEIHWLCGLIHVVWIWSTRSKSSKSSPMSHGKRCLQETLKNVPKSKDKAERLVHVLDISIFTIYTSIEHTVFAHSRTHPNKSQPSSLRK